MDTSALAKRMKQYEAVPKNTLTSRFLKIIANFIGAKWNMERILMN